MALLNYDEDGGDRSIAQRNIIEELVHFLRRDQPGRAPLIVGVAGPPGAGKSTLATKLVATWSGDHSACVSLDDFYLGPAERAARGHRWRAPPGTHDLVRLDAFLDALDAGGAWIAVPRYDRQSERRLAPERVAGPLDLCVFEGWFVGATPPGYERLARSLHRLVYLDIDEERARQSRLSREREARGRGEPALTDDQVIAFWREALGPGVRRWVEPLRDRADFVITVGENHRFERLTVRT